MQNDSTIKKQYRADKNGPHRVAFDRAKKRLLKTQSVCGICGREIDKTLRYPNPLSAVVDHIIPLAKGGHPSDIENLQLAHWQCNSRKSDKLFKEKTKHQAIVGNRNLPHLIDWTTI